MLQIKDKASAPDARGACNSQLDCPVTASVVPEAVGFAGLVERPDRELNKIYWGFRRAALWYRMSGVRVTVVYLGQAREVAGTKEEQVELAAPARVENAVSQAVAAHPRLSELKETIKLLVNGQWAAGNSELKDGDRVTLLPPVGGG